MHRCTGAKECGTTCCPHYHPHERIYQTDQDVCSENEIWCGNMPTNQEVICIPVEEE